jgi:peptidoglycan hydrolase-like protein with peptidoglycan-binding domain
MIIKLTVCIFSLLFCAAVVAAQDTVDSRSNPTRAVSAVGTEKKRGPVFRATKEQVSKAQETLKQRGMYPGTATGKLDDPTRSGLRLFQQAEGLKVTGTLNRVTLEKMGITLTEKQRTM